MKFVYFSIKDIQEGKFNMICQSSVRNKELYGSNDICEYKGDELFSLSGNPEVNLSADGKTLIIKSRSIEETIPSEEEMDKLLPYLSKLQKVQSSITKNYNHPKYGLLNSLETKDILDLFFSSTLETVFIDDYYELDKSQATKLYEELINHIAKSNNTYYKMLSNESLFVMSSKELKALYLKLMEGGEING